MGRDLGWVSPPGLPPLIYITHNFRATALQYMGLYGLWTSRSNIIMFFQMAHNKLSEIHSDSNQWTICVLVSRLWHYRGGTDEGPIKHTDLVLLDSEGTHMYGQIPPAPAERLKGVLEEGKVYIIRKFLCNPLRSNYRPVESTFMVQFMRYTTVEAKPSLEDGFPFCTYSLTALPDIPRPSNNPTRFFDIIGRISNVSDIIHVQSMYQVTTSNTRTILLEDLQGNEIKLVLWGDRAVEFDADAVRAMGATEPVIAIFVGTLPKSAHGVKGLSGGSACRWYIDEDIPDINSFRESLGDRFTPLAAYVPTGKDAIVPRVQENPIDKTVKELDDLDPFVDMDKRFYCVVTVGRLGSDQRWWFPSCSTCRKSAKHNGYGYKCSDDACSSVEADLTYCVSVFASDDTGEAEFMLFDRVATGVLGKTLLAVMRQRYPGCATVDEMANAARHDTFIPREITRLIGQKYKCLVTISKKWKLKNTEKLSFQVNRVEETYKPDLPPVNIGAGSKFVEASSSSANSGGRLPPLGLVMSPPHTPRTYGSPTNQTPPPAVKLSPSTPAARASAPMRGTRRTLFNTPTKSKEQPEDAVGTEVDAPTEDTALEALPDARTSGVKDVDGESLPLTNQAVVEEKDNNAQLAKTKRSVNSTKAGGTTKKNKQ